MLSASLGLVFLIIAILFALFLLDEARPNVVSTYTQLHSGVIQPVKIVYSSLICRIVRRLSGNRIYSLTIWNRVYVSSTYLIPAGRRHELAHVRQWHEWGLWFPIAYLSEHFEKGYKGNTFEEDARRAGAAL